MPMYRLVWSVLFLVALVMTGLTLWTTKWSGPERLPLLRVGINYTRDTTPYLLVYEVPGTLARQAGVRPGDHIVELMNTRDLNEALGTVVDARDGTAIPMTLQRTDGTMRQVTLTARSAEVAGALQVAGLSAPLMAWWTRLILALGAAIVLIAAVLLHRQRENPVAALLAMTSLIAVATPTGIVGYEVGLATAAIAVAATNIAILSFPDGRFATVAIRMLVAANLMWLGVFFVVSPDLHAQGVYPSMALSAIAVVARYRGVRHTTDRQQIRWAALGFAGAAAFAAAAAIVSSVSYRFNGLFDTIANDMATDALDLGNVLCLWGGLSVALLRYRLYDADIAITRSSVWIVVAPSLAIVFGSISEVLKVLLTPIFSNDGVSLAIAGVLTAAMVQPLGDRVRRIVERWSRAPLIALAEDLPAAVRDMEEAADLPRMLDYVCRTTAPALRTTAVAIAVTIGPGEWTIDARHEVTAASADRWLAEYQPPADVASVVDRGDALFPLRIPLIARPDGNKQAIGWLLIGRRPDGTVPDKGAIETLEGIAPAIGHALLTINARDRRMAAVARPQKSRIALT